MKAISAAVGKKSQAAQVRSLAPPALICAGQRKTIGTRRPPSFKLPCPPRNPPVLLKKFVVIARSVCGPPTLVKMTTVFVLIFKSSSFFSNWPTLSSIRVMSVARILSNGGHGASA